MLRNILILLSAIMCAVTLNAGVVKGRVLSSEDESNITGARVTLYEDSVKVSENRTDNRGVFSFDITDGGRNYRIDIDQDGYMPQTLSLTNPRGEVDLGRIMLSPEATVLKDVEVTTNSRVLYLPDKRIIFPSQAEKDRSLNPLNLLAQVSFSDPSLFIDEFNKTISVNGGQPQILINGVKKKYSDFNAIDPQSVLKIEYITHPDIRFGRPYINIITVRPPEGGNVVVDVTAPVTTRQENHQGYFSYNRGKNEVSVNYNGLFRDSRKEYENLTERYFAPDRTYEYSIKGLPSRFIDRDHDASVEYTRVESPKKMFSATAALSYHSGNRSDIQDCDDFSETYRRTTGNYQKILRPSLQLYGSVPVKNDGRLEVSLAGAYSSADFRRHMFQTNGYDNTTSTNSDAYSVNGSVFYSHQLSWSRLGVSLDHTYTETSNKYTIAGNGVRDRMHSNNTSAAASLSGQAGDILYYYASAGVSHYKVDKGYTSPTFNVSLQKNVRNFHLEYSGNYYSSPYGLSSYNDVLLPVNEMLYKSGNMGLKDDRSLGNSLAVTYTYKKFSVRLGGITRRRYNELITIWEYVADPSSPIHGKFIETLRNGDKSDVYRVDLNVKFIEILDHFSILGAVIYESNRSRWENHLWKKDELQLIGQAFAHFGNWQIVAQVSPLPDYSLSGNFLWRNFTSWGVAVGWHKGNWSVRCEMQDLFNKKAFYQEKTLDAIGGFRQSSSWIADKNSWVSLNVRYQLSFGQGMDKPGRNVSGNTWVDNGANMK